LFDLVPLDEGEETSWKRNAKYLVYDTALGRVTILFNLMLKGLVGESAGTSGVWSDLRGDEYAEDGVDDAAR
jgi:hypothetical protein